MTIYISLYLCLCLYLWVYAQSLQLCLFATPRLSLPGSFVRGILHARILDQVAISYCRASSQPRNQTHVSCVSCISRWIFYHCTTWKAISISIYLYLCLYLCIYLKVELLDHMVILCLAFLRNCHTVFHSSRTILHSHQQGTGFQLLHVLDNTCYILFFQHSHPAGCEVVCHDGFCHEFKGLMCCVTSSDVLLCRGSKTQFLSQGTTLMVCWRREAAR